MAKKKSCQNVRVPRVPFVAERELYGWVDEEIFTQPSVVEADALPELHREMRLTVDRAVEGDYVLEAAGPSDRLPFRAQEDRTHYLWVYTELFTRLGIRLPFTDFQRELLSWCRVAASQLHFNRWGFLRTFEWVCLHFGFRPSWRVFLYTYQLHAAPPKRGSCPSVPTRVESSLTLLKSLFKSLSGIILRFCLFLVSSRFGWMMKVRPFRGCIGTPRWGDFRVTALDPLETLAFEFLQSLPVGLGKKSNFNCRWILDHSDADVGVFLDMEKQSRFDRLMQKMKEAEGAGPRSILPSSTAQTTVSGASTSGPVVPASIPASSVPLAPSFGASKAAGKSMSATAAKPFSVEREEGVREDPAADLRQKRRKQNVNPIDRAFPLDYNFRAALDAGLTNGLTREILGPLVPEQLLGTAQFLACQLTACLQVGVENTFATKVQLEKELAAAKEQIKSLTEELERAEGECLSAIERLEEVERKDKVQAAELESCRSTLAQEKKKVESLSQSLKGNQTALDEAETAAAHWRDEWRSLGEETGEMV
ncbi:hypothetical protein PIB30_057721 [Stylosanthes scabra]|uniref:Transposase (Putative), gypsy type n=1 Tax=Stylosanthes scabra TaxID=79078 RepID=A0ABU6QLI3_9FABA|nr:hypothetical protein [Stylosanthes scabra]